MLTSEEIMNSDLHPPNCHLMIGDGPCTCRIGRWHDEVAKLEATTSTANGFDKYLEYQYRQSGDFYNLLFRAIMQADTKNTARLAKGFPSEVEAYRVWTRVGVKEFVKHVSPDHRLLSRFKDEYYLEMIE